MTVKLFSILMFLLYLGVLICFYGTRREVPRLLDTAPEKHGLNTGAPTNVQKNLFFME